MKACMGSKALGFTVEQENLIWDLHRCGESLREIERILGEQCLGFDASYGSPEVSDRSHEHGGPVTSPQPKQKKFREESPPATVLGRSSSHSEDPVRDCTRDRPQRRARELPGGRGRYRSQCPRSPTQNLDPVRSVDSTDRHRGQTDLRLTSARVPDRSADVVLTRNDLPLSQHNVTESVRQHCISRISGLSFDARSQKASRLTAPGPVRSGLSWRIEVGRIPVRRIISRCRGGRRNSARYRHPQIQVAFLRGGRRLPADETITWRKHFGDHPRCPGWTGCDQPRRIVGRVHVARLPGFACDLARTSWWGHRMLWVSATPADTARTNVRSCSATAVTRCPWT